MGEMLKKSCPKCGKKLSERVRRSLLEKLIPYSRKYRCYSCRQVCIKIII